MTDYLTPVGKLPFKTLGPRVWGDGSAIKVLAAQARELGVSSLELVQMQVGIKSQPQKREGCWGGEDRGSQSKLASQTKHRGKREVE